MLSSAKTLMLMENFGESHNKFQNFLKIQMSIVSLLINIKYNPYNCFSYYDCVGTEIEVTLSFLFYCYHHIFPSYTTKDFIREAHNKLAIC